MRVIRVRGGARLVQGDTILSELPARPGPTHSVFDVLAAAPVAFAPGARLLVLGFAAGGIVAPLRALGLGDPIEAVDLSREGEAVFREVAADWCGPVRVAREDALRRLRRSPRRYDAIVEDLSVRGARGAVKPEISFEALPGLIRRRLAPGGVAVTNVLVGEGRTAGPALQRVAAPFPVALVVEFEEFDNRVVVAASRLPPARQASRSLRGLLRRIGSKQAERVRVRTLSVA